MPANKFRIRCDMCSGRGKLWLSGADYLECPQCEGKRTVEVVETLMQAKTKTVFIPGLRPVVVSQLPQRSLVGDVLIPRRA